MPTIQFEGRRYDCREDETVLDALLRQGQSPPFSCRSGACLACLQRCTQGDVPEAAQRALRPELRRAGYFLPCKCRPTGDLELAAPRPEDLFTPAEVAEKCLLAPDVCRLRLEPSTYLHYRSGQHLTLRRGDGVQRSYSLVSSPEDGATLELHVKRRPGGALSGWIFDELQVGDEVSLQGPLGRLHYVPGTQTQDLLLVGSGTGAAPLLGVARDALREGHRGRVVVVIGGRSAEALYLHDTFTQLAQAEQVTYIPCVSGPDAPPGFQPLRADQAAAALFPVLKGWRVFAAGPAGQVASVEEHALRAGVAPTAIHTDPFTAHDQQLAPNAAEPPHVDVAPPPPDPELWAALGEGALLRVVLDDFYTRVFDDALLAPYFRGVTQERLVGQVYAFMRDAITGERAYFGARPRSAHHWMIISDEIFDHREQLMEHVLSQHGLSAPHIERWRRIEESYRGDIVKSTPWKLVIDGFERPLEGFGELELSAGTLCDACQRAVEVGERVSYHLRLGLTYCDECRGEHPSGEAAQ